MEINALKKLIHEALEDLKSVDVKEFNVIGKTSVTDYMIIATGNSTRQVKAIANNVEMELKKSNTPALGVEGQAAGEWVLIDAGDIIVHVMTREQRDFYDLERLWTTPVAETTDTQA